MSQDLLDAARAEVTLPGADFEGLHEIAPQELRGRAGVLRVWTLSGADGI